MNMSIYVIGTLNEIFMRGPYTEIKFSKQGVSGKTPLFVKGQFCTPHSPSRHTTFIQR